MLVDHVIHHLSLMVQIMLHGVKKFQIFLEAQDLTGVDYLTFEWNAHSRLVDGEYVINPKVNRLKEKFHQQWLPKKQEMLLSLPFHLINLLMCAITRLLNKLGINS